MSIDEMQAIRKKRGLLHTENSTNIEEEKNKNRKPNMSKEKETDLNTVEIRFIKKINLS